MKTPTTVAEQIREERFRLTQALAKAELRHAKLFSAVEALAGGLTGIINTDPNAPGWMITQARSALSSAACQLKNL